MKINKRILILILMTLLIAFSFYQIKYKRIEASEIKTGSELSFFVASDTHYIAESLTDGGKAFQEFVRNGDGKELNYIHEIMSAFAYNIKNKKPDVLIISGDLTSNGEKESHVELAERLKEIEKTGARVYVIPGNHDILNPHARSFKGDSQYVTEYINERDFARIYGSFGYNEAISRDKNTLSYLAAPSEDVWLLMLDTAQYSNNLRLGYPQKDGRISPETLEWIKKSGDLAKSKGAQLIAVMHHNLIDHNSTVKEGYTINDNKAALSVFEQYNIKLALSGHIHLQDIKSYNKEEYQVYDIATGSISVYPQKYGVLKYSPEEGFYYNTAGVDVENWSRDTGIADYDLNNFREHAKKLYGDRIYSRAVSRLGITDFYTSEELKLMGEVYKTLNLRYYEGEKEVGNEEIRNSAGYKLWLSAENTFLRQNLIRLVDANGEENHKLHIEKNR